MAIQHNRDFEPRYGECIQIAPLIRRVVAQNPNPFTFTGTGVYLIGQGDVAVIDPGPELEEHLDAILDCLEPGETISKILITHTHSDHTAGVPGLKERTGARSYGFGPHGEVASAEDPMADLDFSDHISAEENQRFAEEWAAIPDELKREGPDVGFVPDEVVGHGPKDHRGATGTISGGASPATSGDTWTVEVVPTPGHTSNHVCFRLLDEGTGQSAVFTGDHVMGWATTVIAPPDGDLMEYMASLERLLLVEDAMLVPTHGPIIHEPHQYIRSLINHRNGRTQQILDQLSSGPKSLVDLVAVMYTATDKRLWRAAAMSVYSHLLALADQGQAGFVDDKWRRIAA